MQPRMVSATIGAGYRIEGSRIIDRQGIITQWAVILLTETETRGIGATTLLNDLQLDQALPVSRGRDGAAEIAKHKV